MQLAPLVIDSIINLISLLVWLTEQQPFKQHTLLLSAPLISFSVTTQMKTHQFFLLPLLLLRGFLAADSISPNETKPKKAELLKIKRENNALLLKKSNFGQWRKLSTCWWSSASISFCCLSHWWLCRAWRMLWHFSMLALPLLCPQAVLVSFVFLHVSISDHKYIFIPFWGG